MSEVKQPERPKWNPKWILLAVVGVVVVLLVAAAAGMGGEAVVETEVWEDSESVENAVHDAVENMTSRGLLAEGDRFRVVEIQGTVGKHGSPYHITYSARIEVLPGGEG
jgi:hypothetical protein